jgi:hypothetical protein
MKTKQFFSSPFFIIGVLVLVTILIGCEKSTIQDAAQDIQPKHHRLDIGFDELIGNAEIRVTVTPRSHGYVAEGRGRGTIPAGEYAGQRFQITLEANYSGIGLETLIDGEALVRIRGERFESVMNPLLQSFCCGEGHLQIVDDEYVFTMFGQVNHITADEPHNHLFAGLATTAGTMNMNIADQSGTVVEQIDPPHDPGIGLIEGFDAQYVHIDLH